jgi:hypothetical protein
MRLRRAEGVVLRHVAGEYMLVPAVTREVDLDSLFLLNSTGAWVWERLDGTVSVDDLVQAVREKFPTEPETAAADVSRFLASLLERHLAAQVERDGT